MYKSSLIFYEFHFISIQNANSIPPYTGSITEMAKITTRRIYFSDGNYYSPFYMPYWPSYGALLYIQVDSQFSVRIDKARTDMSNDIVIPKGWLAIFINDLTKWKFIANMKTQDFVTATWP